MYKRAVTTGKEKQQYVHSERCEHECRNKTFLYKSIPLAILTYFLLYYYSSISIDKISRIQTQPKCIIYIHSSRHYIRRAEFSSSNSYNLHLYGVHISLPLSLYIILKPALQKVDQHNDLNDRNKDREWP